MVVDRATGVCSHRQKGLREREREREIVQTCLKDHRTWPTCLVFNLHHSNFLLSFLFSSFSFVGISFIHDSTRLDSLVFTFLFECFEYHSLLLGLPRVDLHFKVYTSLLERMSRGGKSRKEEEIM